MSSHNILDLRGEVCYNRGVSTHKPTDRDCSRFISGGHTTMRLYLTLAVVLLVAIPLTAIAYGTSVGDNSTQDSPEWVIIAPIKEVAPVVTSSPNTESPRYDSLVREYSQEYQVSYKLMDSILTCENDTRNPNRQSEVRYNQKQIDNNPSWGNVGDFEKSFGLAMIHIPACNKYRGKCITETQAKDPEFAISYMASEISKGNSWKWTCYYKVRDTI